MTDKQPSERRRPEIMARETPTERSSRLRATEPIPKRRHDGISELRLMAEAGGYVMIRRKDHNAVCQANKMVALIARGTRMLTEEQQKARENRLTASRVGCLMSGDSAKILNLWREMVGSPEFVPEELDHYWPAVLGAFTEPLQLDWYEYRTGSLVSRRGEVVIHPQYDWAACTLDGWDDTIPAAIEAKHVGGYEPRATVIARYQPQFHWIMHCTVTQQTQLSIIEGAREPAIERIPWDAEYADELWRRAEWFMRHVWNLTPPVEVTPIAAPIVPVKTYDMSASNAWAEHAAVWLANASSAKLFVAAGTELKALVPEDAVKALAHGIIATRNKAGAITIKEHVNG